MWRYHASKERMNINGHPPEKGEGPIKDSVVVESLMTLEQGLSVLDKQGDYIENQMRCNNICTDGLKELKGEIWPRTEDKCLDLFRNWLDLSDIQVERVHRIGPQIQGKPRTIVMKLLTFKQREMILTKSMQQKPFLGRNHRECLWMKTSKQRSWKHIRT